MGKAKENPRRFVTFLQDHVEITPATVLESHTFDGKVHHVADVPEHRQVFHAGEVVDMGTVAAARTFARHYAGKGVAVRIGKETACLRCAELPAMMRPCAVCQALAESGVSS